MHERLLRTSVTASSIHLSGLDDTAYHVSIRSFVSMSMGGAYC